MATKCISNNTEYIMPLKLPVDGNGSDGAQSSGEKSLMKSEIFTVIGVRLASVPLVGRCGDLKDENPSLVCPSGTRLLVSHSSFCLVYQRSKK